MDEAEHLNLHRPTFSEQRICETEVKVTESFHAEIQYHEAKNVNCLKCVMGIEKLIMSLYLKVMSTIHA